MSGNSNPVICNRNAQCRRQRGGRCRTMVLCQPPRPSSKTQQAKRAEPKIETVLWCYRCLAKGTTLYKSPLNPDGRVCARCLKREKERCYEQL